jgi:hypothetical protein
MVADPGPREGVTLTVAVADDEGVPVADGVRDADAVGDTVGAPGVVAEAVGEAVGAAGVVAEAVGEAVGAAGVVAEAVGDATDGVPVGVPEVAVADGLAVGVVEGGMTLLETEAPQVTSAPPPLPELLH